MKYVIYVTKDGWKRRSMIKDDDSERNASYGIPSGPPDISMMDWDSILRDVNNTLVDYGIFTWDDAIRNKTGWQAALNVIKRALVSELKTFTMGE